MATRARRAPAAQPKRTLAVLLVIIAALFAGVAATTAWANPKGQWTPKLGLDLQGGRQIILAPQLGKGQSVSSGQVNQAVNIIRNRVDGTGVAEAEVTTLGSSNIVVSLPGNPSRQVLDSLAESSALSFRAVIQTGQATADQPQTHVFPGNPTPSASATGTASGTASGTATGTGTASSTASPTASASPTSTGTATATSTPANDVFPPAYAATSSAATSSAATSSASPSGTSTPSPSGSATATTPTAAPTPTLPGATAPAVPAGTPTGASDTLWASKPVSSVWVQYGLAKTGETYAELLNSISCTNTNAKNGPLASTWREAAAVAPKNQPSVACSSDHTTTYLMGPVEVDGTEISDASAGRMPNAQGDPVGSPAVFLTFNAKGSSDFGKVTKRLAALQGDQNKFAIVMDGSVINAPGTEQEITGGKAQISGGFTVAQTETLANQLKFGALPFSFKILSSDQISPQLGSDQLRDGLIAGVIGLLLVVLYSLFQYRALGFVTVASLVVAALISYLAVTFLGFANGFRLTMAGVTGLIVAIGITADSFIVYFERVRDEVRIGRPLRAAVETGWSRAKRTIIISDSVNFLAAAVLYILSESNVKGFAFTLGLTTIIDLLVVMMFTHPVLTMLARTKFFGGGHKWSGFDPERLGAKNVTYAGRGRVTIADRKAAAVEGGTL